ncbi:hypothetical protein KFE25_000570 [Diacronema lutheri]|uniref:peptidylprolyl isomerase n=1 Tax=Diacronema lutheri TaxID=2081491 RepID=A0A8J5XVG2_DIALT|nr:hypothetical protein KFE25_000570 [Diacronema lutheri]
MSVSADLSGDGGVLKRTLVPGNITAPRPSPGAVAVVHFVAWLANGTEIGSTRGVEPLEIRLGVEPSQAIKGWELAIPAMHTGEKALVTCAGAYAYGAAGAPPLIPPDATLAFELDLLSWHPGVVRGGTAEGISRRWIDKLLDLDAEGISMPTASANEMLHQMVTEENAAAAAAAAARRYADGRDGAAAAGSMVVDQVESDERELTDAADMRALRERARALKERSAGASGMRGPAGAERELEVVGGGLMGEPIVQELYRKMRGEAERHSWVEGRNDLEVSVTLPDGAGAAQAAVSLERRWLRVQTSEFVLEGALVRDIDLEASSWLVQPAAPGCSRSLYILLVKRDPKLERWGGVFELDASVRAAAERGGGVADPATAVQIHYDLPRTRED